MKIQSTDNLSYKAYFKPNNEFKKLWGKSNKENIKETLYEFTYNLPNHKLEIIDSDKYVDGCKTQMTYNIFNDTTKKLISCDYISWTNTGNDLLRVLESLLKKNSMTENFFKADSTLTNFNTITKSLK